MVMRDVGGDDIIYHNNWEHVPYVDHFRDKKEYKRKPDALCFRACAFGSATADTSAPDSGVGGATVPSFSPFQCVELSNKHIGIEKFYQSTSKYMHKRVHQGKNVHIILNTAQNSVVAMAWPHGPTLSL